MQELEGVERGLEWRPGTAMELWFPPDPVVKETMARKSTSKDAH